MPQSSAEERIRQAVAANPRKMTLQLARDLGVPEVDVIRAFPPDRAMLRSCHVLASSCSR